MTRPDNPGSREHLRNVIRGLRAVQAGWAFGVPEDGREQWLDQVCDAITAWQAAPDPATGWTYIGTTTDGGRLYTAPPGTPLPGATP